MSTQPIDPNLPFDYVTVFIDGVELAAPKGSMIIHAADKAGIAIPRFCYHDKLAVAANCRMCLVEVEKMPKPAPACAIPVMDGMRVTTRSEKTLKSQRNVMEMLLINHPLDCPICDQGGECELQDVAMGYGRSVSRFAERKRTVADEDFGPLVSSDMTRCIQCTRCVRFTGEIAGTYELGGMYRGENLQIGTYDGKPLMSELSGNVIDVCPVGALTDKVFRFKARPWELIAKESLGYHDALGSNLFLHLHRGKVLRTVPRNNEAVNECWLSDRDRYSHQGLYAQDRALQPLLRDGEALREVSWDQALAQAAKILRDHSGDEVGVLVHPSTSNEEGTLLARLTAALGSGNLDHRIGQLDCADDAVAEAFATPSSEIEQADAIIIVGSNLRAEVPLLHQRVRKAFRRGTKVHVLNPVDFDFAFEAASQQIVPPSRLAQALAQIDLGDVASPVLILGAIAEQGLHAATIRTAASAWAKTRGATLCRIPSGANAVGLAQCGVLPTTRDALSMLRDPRAAYVLYGIEPGLDFADQALALKALTGAKVLAFSHFACQSMRAVADVVLPIGVLPEIDATLTNLDGRAQRGYAGGKLPGEARAGWRVLRALGGALEFPGFDFSDLRQLRADMVSSAPENVVARGNSTRPRQHKDERSVAVGSAVMGPVVMGLEVVASQAIYRSDAIVRRAPALQAHPLNIGPRVSLHPDDGKRLGLDNGVMAKIGSEVGIGTLQVVINDRVAPGCAWIETGYGATAPLTACSRVEVRLA